MTSIEVLLYDLVKSTTGLLLVVDPIGTVPIILSLTKGMQEKDRKRNFRTATYTGSALLVLFALVGQQLLSLFGISLYSFMIAGGILLLLVSIDILIRGETTEKIGATEDVGAIPIAFPLLVGPGAITTTIVILQSSGLIVALLSILIVMTVTWAVMRLVGPIYALLGKTGSAVIAKLMAVFVAAIAIQYMLSGIQFYYPPRN